MSRGNLVVTRDTGVPGKPAASRAGGRISVRALVRIQVRRARPAADRRTAGGKILGRGTSAGRVTCGARAACTDCSVDEPSERVRMHQDSSRSHNASSAALQAQACNCASIPFPAWLSPSTSSQTRKMSGPAEAPRSDHGLDSRSVPDCAVCEPSASRTDVVVRNASARMPQHPRKRPQDFQIRMALEVEHAGRLQRQHDVVVREHPQRLRSACCRSASSASIRGRSKQNAQFAEDRPSR